MEKKNKLKWLDTEYIRADLTIQPVLLNEDYLLYTMLDRKGYNYVFVSIYDVVRHLNGASNAYIETFETEAEMIDWLGKY